MTNKTWGGRFTKPLDEQVVQFNASLSFDHVLAAYDIQGSCAHVRMLAQQGLLSSSEATTLLKGLEEIKQAFEAGAVSLDPACEDIHMLVETLLIQKVGEVGKKLHTGRSRNDQVALDLRLYSRAACVSLQANLLRLQLTLKGLSEKHCQDLMPGYTHLQQAQPVTLGAYFGAFHAMLSRDHDRLAACAARLNFSPLGAGALAGSQLSLDRHYVAEQLGFSGVVDNTLDAVSDRDFVIELISVCAQIMVHLSRLSEDLIIWATQEFGFISLDDAFSTGSSLMPNKKNPDVLELIRGKSGRVFGHLMGLLTVMKGLPMAYNKDMQEDKEGLFDTVKTVEACVGLLPAFLESVTFHTAHMKQVAQSGYLDATAQLEQLVKQGMPFREAHHQVGQWVKEAIEKQCSLQDLIKNASLKGDCKPLSPSPVTPLRPRTLKHWVTGTEFNSEEIQQLITLARHLKKSPQETSQALKGKKLVMMFEKPSLRTRLSFSLAIQSLGGYCVESLASTRKTEQARDVMQVLNGYADYVMIRTHEEKIFDEMSSVAKIPLINGLSAKHHPCQALADFMVLEEKFGHLKGLTLAYIGDGNNVLHSLMLLGSRMGVRIHYCCPELSKPCPEIVRQCAPGMVKFCATPQLAVEGADAVYTDVWSSMGFEGQGDEARFKWMQVNEALMSHAKSTAVFMHCMPMERGKELSETLPEQPYSVIFEQSENRLHVQKALLLYLKEL